MPSSAVTLWKDIVQLLQRPSGPLSPQDERMAAAAVREKLEALDNMAPMPKATRKELVKELQVPRHLGLACIRSSSSSSSSSSSGGSGGNSSARLRNPLSTPVVCWQALLQFVIATAEGASMTETKLINPQKTGSTSLTQAMLQQLERCGLIQQLPNIMKSAAFLLFSARIRLPPAAETAAAAAAAGTARAAAAAAAAAGTAGAAGAASATQGKLSSTQCGMIVDCVCWSKALLNVAASLVGLTQSSADRQALYGAVAHLALAMLQAGGNVVDSVEPTRLSHPEMRDLTSSMGSAFDELSNIGRYLPTDPAAEFTRSPMVTQALSLVVFVTYCHALLPAAGPLSASSSSSSSSSDTAVGAAAAAAAAADAVKRWRQLAWQLESTAGGIADASDDPCKDITGVSMAAALWLAIHARSAGVADALFVARFAAQAVVARCMMGVERPQEQRRRQQQEQQQQQQQASATDSAKQVQQVLLLSQVHMQNLVLHHSSSSSSSSSSSILASDCEGAATVAGAAASCAQKLYRGDKRLDQMLAGWFEPLMPDVLELMSRLLQQMQGSGQDSTSGSSSSSSTGDGSNSSRAGSSSSSSSSIARNARDAWALNESIRASTPAYQAAFQLARVMCIVLEQGDRVELAMSGPEAVRKWVWYKHSSRLTQLLEGLVRASVRFIGKPGALQVLANMLEAVSVWLVGGDRCGPLYVSALSAPADGPERRQFQSLLITLTKLSVVVRPTGQLISAGAGLWQAAVSARSQILDATSRELEARDHNGTGSADASVAAVSAAGTAAAAATVVPWLVLFGRCCLQWGAELQQLQMSSPNLGQSLVGIQRSRDGTFAMSAVERGLRVYGNHATVVALGDGSTPLTSTAIDVYACLTSAPMTQELAALGFPAEGVTQKLESYLTSLNGVRVARDPAAAATAYGLMVQELLSLGVVLCTMATPTVCNNPGCSNMAGAAETETVSGRSCMCAGCKVARYCSRVCQKQHWKQHKPVCQALAAAGAADKLQL